MGKTFKTFDCFVYIVVVILHINFIGFILLILSSDVELNPGPVNRRNRQCCVLYSNIRGLYRNLHDLIVASKGFDILFCSETLVSNFRCIAELSIPGFKRPILFKRNEIKRAQGMAVYIRNGCSACHEVQIIKVCGKHNFYLFSVYRNPDADDGIFDCLLVSMAAIQENDRKASCVFIGDFNAHHKEWLNSISQTDCHGLRALDFSESGCDQIIHNPTHRSGNSLDLMFTDTPGAVAGNVGSPIGTSDHCHVSPIVKTEKEYNDGVKDTLIGTTNSHKWWSTLKTALFGVDVAVPPLLRPDGSLAHCPKGKAALFADVFDSKQSSDSLTMPQSCFPEAELTTFAFRSD